MTQRIEIQISETEVEKLNWLMEVCGIQNRKELFNVALTMFEWMVRETIEGRSVGSIDNHHIRELSMQSLDHVKSVKRVPDYKLDDLLVGITTENIHPEV